MQMKIFPALCGLLLSLNSISGAEINNLTRTEDPLVIFGEKFPEFLGKDMSALGLFALKQGKVLPIPFQIDEKTTSGEYVFTEGEKKNQDPDPKFDANDELVFMAFDAGDRTDQVELPDLTGAYEIEISDPLGRGKAWVYLCSFSKIAARSAVDYVKMDYDKATKHFIVTAPNYFTKSTADAIIYDYLALPKPGGGFGPDLVDQLKIRGIITAFFGTLKIPFNFDQLVKSKVTSWKDGPVRILRRGEGYLEIAEVKIKGSGSAVLFFYPNFFIYPMTIDMPLDLEAALTDMDLQGVTDFSKSAYGWNYYDAQNPPNPQVVLDGKMSEAEKSLKIHFDHDWLCHINGPGNYCHRIIFPQAWSFIAKEVFYLDDAELKDPPESEPGLIAIGYNFINFVKVKKGPQTYWMHYYFPANFRPGQEWIFMDILDHPLKIEVQKIK